MSDDSLFLSPTLARVLAVLVEKQFTTPDVYPLTANALLSGCNQKTSRDPVMNLGEGEVLSALEELRGLTLVVESYGASGRVLRYAQNLDRVLRLSAPQVSILAVLMLKGPQTSGELRTGCDRLYRFPDLSSLEAYLEELADRKLVVRLPKQPGAREHRYGHLLGGMPELAAMPTPAGGEGDMDTLRAEIADLRRLVAHLYAELGVAEPARE